MMIQLFVREMVIVVPKILVIVSPVILGAVVVVEDSVMENLSIVLMFVLDVVSVLQKIIALVLEPI